MISSCEKCPINLYNWLATIKPLDAWAKSPKYTFQIITWKVSLTINTMGESMYWTIVLGLVSWTTSYQLESSLYESSQYPNALASAFYLAFQAFWYRIEYPKWFEISTIKLLIGIDGFVFTEWNTMEAIWFDSRFIWSGDKFVDKHICGESIFLISHFKLCLL